MNAVIKIKKDVLDTIVYHANLNNTLECGGYLYGYSKKTFNGIEIVVVDVYLKILGQHNSFNLIQTMKEELYTILMKIGGVKSKIALMVISLMPDIKPFFQEDRKLKNVDER